MGYRDLCEVLGRDSMLVLLTPVDEFGDRAAVLGCGRTLGYETGDMPTACGDSTTGDRFICVVTLANSSSEKPPQWR